MAQGAPAEVSVAESRSNESHPRFYVTSASKESLHRTWSPNLTRNRRKWENANWSNKKSYRRRAEETILFTCPERELSSWWYERCWRQKLGLGQQTVGSAYIRWSTKKRIDSKRVYRKSGENCGWEDRSRRAELARFGARLSWSSQESWGECKQN